MGLLHQICPSGELDGLVASCVDDIVQGSPASLPATKALVQTVAHRAVTDQVVAEPPPASPTSGRAARQAGIACAIDGVLPPWMEDHESSVRRAENAPVS